MGEGKFDLPMDFLLYERPYYDRSGDLDRAPCDTHKNSLLVMGSSFCRQPIKSDHVFYDMSFRHVHVFGLRF